MTAPPRYDVVCVGAGIVGLATAVALVERFRCRLVVVEAEPRPAVHQTGHNSGVLHSGLYYRPGSLKARSCVEGRRRLVDLCAAQGITHEVCGKLVVATSAAELPRLDELERRGRANGLTGLRRVPAAAIADVEPNAIGVGALLVPETGIVDFVAVCQAYARRLQELGGELRCGRRVVGFAQRDDGLLVETNDGRLLASALVNCAGLQCDRVARLAGVRPHLRIVPFRGDYYELVEARRSLVRHLIYPVPDPRFPFLGVHLTRRIGGAVEAGPNAVLALRRDGYRRASFSLRDTLSTLSFPGFWRLTARYWRVGARELWRASSRQRFGRELRRFVPTLADEDLKPAGCGVRAQALDRQGRLLDDFEIAVGPRSLHVLNAPSPAATASLAIGDYVAEMAGRELELKRRPAG